MEFQKIPVDEPTRAEIRAATNAIVGSETRLTAGSIANYIRAARMM